MIDGYCYTWGIVWKMDAFSTAKDGRSPHSFGRNTPKQVNRAPKREQNEYLQYQLKDSKQFPSLHSFGRVIDREFSASDSPQNQIDNSCPENCFIIGNNEVHSRHSFGRVVCQNANFKGQSTLLGKDNLKVSPKFGNNMLSSPLHDGPNHRAPATEVPDHYENLSLKKLTGITVPSYESNLSSNTEASTSNPYDNVVYSTTEKLQSASLNGFDITRNNTIHLSNEDIPETTCALKECYQDCGIQETSRSDANADPGIEKVCTDLISFLSIVVKRKMRGSARYLLQIRVAKESVLI